MRSERRRCLIVADGFYEWQPREHGPKQPWWITRADHEPFAFAGLWATWRPEPDGAPLRTCTIITTAASDGPARRPRPHAGDPAAQAEARWLQERGVGAAL